MKHQEKLLLAFEVARTINEALWMSGVDPQYVRVDQLQNHIAETWGVRIELYVVDVENDHVLGFIERYDDGKAKVYLVKTIGNRQKRLVAVKELCHVAIDVQEDFSIDAIDTLERMVTFGLDIDAPENLALRSETLAEMVSWELLYPHEYRRRDKEALAQGTTTLALLAQKYQIPENTIALVLRGPYLDMCDQYWARVEADHQASVRALKLVKE